MPWTSRVAHSSSALHRLTLQHQGIPRGLAGLSLPAHVTHFAKWDLLKPWNSASFIPCNCNVLSGWLQYASQLCWPNSSHYSDARRQARCSCSQTEYFCPKPPVMQNLVYFTQPSPQNSLSIKAKAALRSSFCFSRAPLHIYGGI